MTTSPLISLRTVRAGLYAPGGHSRMRPVADCDKPFTAFMGQWGQKCHQRQENRMFPSLDKSAAAVADSH